MEYKDKRGTITVSGTNKIFGRVLAKAIDENNVSSDMRVTYTNDILSNFGIYGRNLFYGVVEATPPPIITQTINPFKDTFVSTEFKTFNYGFFKNLHVGNKDNIDYKTYINFNISNIPPEMEFINAKLRFNIQYTDNNIINVYETDEHWNEYGLTYLNQPITKNKIKTYETNSYDKTLDIDLLDFILNKIDNEKNEINFILESESGGYTKLFSKESYKPPELIIEYYDPDIKSFGKIQVKSNIIIKKNHNDDLVSNINIKRYNDISNLKSSIYIRTPDMLMSNILINRSLIKSNIIVKQNKSNDINSNIKVRHNTINEISGNIVISKRIINSNLIITRYDSINSNINIYNHKNLLSNIKVINHNSINSNLIVTGFNGLISNIKVQQNGNKGLNSNIIIRGNNSINTNIKVTKFNNLDSNIVIQRNENKDLDSNMTVCKYNSINSSIFVNPNGNLNSNIIICRYDSINGNLQVNKFSNLDSKIIITRSKIKSNIIITRFESINSNIEVISNSNLSSNLIVTNYNTINSKLIITTFNSLNSNIIIRQHKDSDLNSKLIVTTNDTINSSLTITKYNDINSGIFIGCKNDFKSKMVVRKWAFSEINTNLIIGKQNNINGNIVIKKSFDFESNMIVKGMAFNEINSNIIIKRKFNGYVFIL